MWSGRFREPLDPAFEAWQRSLPVDWRLLPHEIAASKAHARMIAGAGILTEAELTTMLEGLDRVIPTAMEDASQVTNLDALKAANPNTGAGTSSGFAIVALNPNPEDIHHFVELTLTKIIGDIALKLHTGRSRNEQIATATPLSLPAAIARSPRH